MSARSMTTATAAAIALMLSLGAGPLAAQDKPDGKEDVRGRMEYFYRQRVFPFDSFPKGAMAAARAAVANMRHGNAAVVSAGAPWLAVGPVGLQAPDGFWTSAPQTDEGRITSIAVHPTNSQIAFAGSASGGVWRTTSGGASWTPVTDSQCSLATGSIAFDPVNPSIIYVGTGEVGQAWYGCGVLRSVDGGNTWTQLGASVFDPPSGAGASIPRVLIDRASAGSASSTILLAASNAGLYRSSNSGSTWTQVASGQFTDLAQHPGDANVFYAAAGNLFNDARNGVYRSGDRGVTWTKLPLPLTQGPGRSALAVTPALPKSVFLAASIPIGAGDAKLQGIWRWDDDVARWTQLAAAGVYAPIDRGDFGAQTWYNLVFAVHPLDPNRMYVGGLRLYRSTDAGATFTRIANNTHVDWHALVIDARNPTTIFGGNDGGVHLSYDGGDTWVSRNTNLSITQFYAGIAVHPALPNQIMGGLQDNGTVMGNGLPTWDALFGGDGGYTAINYLDPSISWLTCQWGANPPCLYRRSTSPTVRLENRGSGITSTDRASFIPPLVMDPVTPTTLYFGTFKLYKTTNEGLTWTSSGADLTKGAPGTVSAIAPSVSDPQTVYVGTTDGNVQVSTDGGTTFTLRTNGLPNRAATDIAVDRANSQRAVVTFSGFGVPHVYLTTDGGATWTSISSGLPDVPHNAVALIPGGNRMFVGTDLGVYESGDNGASWTPGPSGMPNVTVTDLVYHLATGTLIASTHGRGVYLSALTAAAAVLRGDVNRDGAVTAVDALYIQQALVGIAMPAGVTALPQGDANCNGRLDATDALLVLRFSVGLPIQGACVGTVR